MTTAKRGTRGVLYSQHSDKNYVLTRAQPSQHLSHIVDTFWLVTWDLTNQLPHIQQNIPDPCLNMVFEAARSRIVGAVTKRYQAELSSAGQIFGIKFLPGGFYTLTGNSVSELTDTECAIEAIFGNEASSLIEEIDTASDIENLVEISETFLLSIASGALSKQKNTQNKAHDIVQMVNDDSSIMRVRDLSEKCGLGERTIQRLFKQQVGVSPKWVIRKCRIQEVLGRLDDGSYDWQWLIQELDYFDQSHFIKDFKALVGITPSDYVKRLQSHATDTKEL